MNTITNKNGEDNASCPRCGHYNAMLGTGRRINDEEVYSCRDCGMEAFVVNPVADAPAAPPAADVEPAAYSLQDRIAALNEAMTILDVAKGATCSGATAIFSKVNNAYKYLDRQIAELLADDERVDETLGAPRDGAFTEPEWKEKYADYEGDGSIPSARVVVEWDDPGETPSEAIDRLNQEVLAASGVTNITDHYTPTGPGPVCPACGGTMFFDGSLGNFNCDDQTGCRGVRMTKERIKRLIDDGLILFDVIDVVCELNHFVGVGYLTFGDQVGGYIKEKASKGLSAEAWLNS